MYWQISPDICCITDAPKHVLEGPFSNTHSSDPALILHLGFIQTKANGLVQRQSWENKQPRAKKHCKPLHPSVRCRLWIFQSLLLWLLKRKREPDTKSTKVLCVVRFFSATKNPSKRDLSLPASQPPAGAGFQSDSIIDGSRWLRPQHTVSPRQLSSAGASLPRDEAAK